MSVDSCIHLDALADELVEEFGDRLWTGETDPEVRDRMILGALAVAETQPAQEVPPELAVEIAADWIAYATMEELRARYATTVPQLGDPTTLNLFIQSTFASGVPWSLSALLTFLDVRVPQGETLIEGLRALPALVKFGVDSPRAAYASTLAAQDRDTARKLAEMASSAGVQEGFAAFLRWLSELRVEELRQGLGSGPDTHRLAAAWPGYQRPTSPSN